MGGMWSWCFLGCGAQYTVHSTVAETGPQILVAAWQRTQIGDAFYMQLTNGDTTRRVAFQCYSGSVGFSGWFSSNSSSGSARVVFPPTICLCKTCARRVLENYLL